LSSVFPKFVLRFFENWASANVREFPYNWRALVEPQRVRRRACKTSRTIICCSRWSLLCIICSN